MLALLLFLAPLQALRVPGPLSPRNANYRLQATLDPTQKLVSGHVHITWRNDAAVPATELVLHLYMNAFRNNRSTFMKESHGRHRGNASEGAHRWGAIDVDKLLVDGRPATMTVDDTLGTIALERPIAPGATVEIDADFTTRLPRIFAHTGWADDFFAIAQWYPKMAVFDQHWGKWRANQLHLNSEFFADFGDYDVTVDVPANFLVGASGVEGARIEKNGRASIAFHAEDVTDFAWFASPKFQEQLDSWDGIRLRLLGWPGIDGARQFAAVKTTLAELARRYGPYPYSQITIIGAPLGGAEGAGGMEYPTLFTTLSFPVPRSLHIDEWVTIHELSHQYTQGMLSSDEAEEAWLDEGFTEAMTDWGMSRLFGREASLYEFPGHRLAYDEAERLGYRLLADRDPPATPSWAFLDNASYSINSYSKIDLTLRTVEKLIGADKLEAGMRHYYEKARFTHPRREDFLRLFAEGSGADVSGFFHATLETTDRLDYQVLSVTAELIGKPAGLITTDGHEVEVSPSPDPQAPWRSEVVIHRKGEMVLPPEVRVVFDDGSERRERWDDDGSRRWHRYTYETPKPVRYAEINRVPLDVSRLNDGKLRKPDGGPRRRILGRLQRALSLALAWVGF
jgi:hypothetical protein